MEMLGFLYLEEAKAHIGQQDLDTAWKSIEKARAAGFDRLEALTFDPTFASLVAKPDVAATLQTWVLEDVDKKMAAQERFPFEFTLQSLTDGGKEVSLTDFKGKPVIVDIWGTWCPPCRAVIPHLVELHEKHKDELAIVGLNFEQQAGANTFEEAQGKLNEFLQAQSIPYSCLYGERSVLEQIPGFRAFPTMLFVDKAGEVRLVTVGGQPEPVVEAIVAKLISE